MAAELDLEPGFDVDLTDPAVFGSGVPHAFFKRAVGRLAGHFQKPAVDIIKPAVIAAAQSAVLDMAKLERRSAMRTAESKQPNPPLREGMTLAIEPMVNQGGMDIEMMPDMWTAVTKDRSRDQHPGLSEKEHAPAVDDAGHGSGGQPGQEDREAGRRLHQRDQQR